jgi:hypothetical protein
MKKLIVIFLLFVIAGKGYSQQMKNLYDFDEARMHFGFVLGYNKADFYLDKNTEYGTSIDTLMVLEVEPKSGFNLGIVSSLNLTPNLKIRLVPSLSFQERVIEYTYFKQPDTSEFWHKEVQPVFLDFPLLVKFRTNRINNFAAYIIGGGRFGLDMSSSEGVKNSSATLEDQIVKTSRADYGLEIGGGIDLFMEYFKFGVELKLGMGLKNMLIQENLKFSSPIESLRSKVWTLSFTFEG